MARKVVGSILRDKEDPKKSYIKFNADVTFKQGDYLNIESKEDQLKSLDAAIAASKISEELGERLREKINNLPPFVRFELVTYGK